MQFCSPSIRGRDLGGSKRRPVSQHGAGGRAARLPALKLIIGSGQARLPWGGGHGAGAKKDRGSWSPLLCPREGRQACSWQPRGLPVLLVATFEARSMAVGAAEGGYSPGVSPVSPRLPSTSCPQAAPRVCLRPRGEQERAPQAQGRRGGCRVRPAAEAKDALSLCRDTGPPVLPSFLFFETCAWNDLSHDEFTFQCLSEQEAGGGGQKGHRSPTARGCPLRSPRAVGVWKPVRRSGMYGWKLPASSFSGTRSVVGMTRASCSPCSPLSVSGRVSSLQVPHRAGLEAQGAAGSTGPTGTRVPTHPRSLEPWAAVLRLPAASSPRATHSVRTPLPPLLRRP